MEEKKVTVIKGKGLSKGTNSTPGRKPRVCAYCRVSTNTAEQKDSFESQKSYYAELIASNPAWVDVGIYADLGLTGTKADARPEFQRMIKDAMEGNIDIILTKSISRFSRNTLDMLNYVRMLKDKRVEVRFEEERLNTLSQEGELMITLLSSMAQQEVVNTSEHVKKGLAMKMTEGQLVGFATCLGYDVDPKTKNLVIVPEEAEIVRYIFKRYNEGAGTTVLAHELEEHGWKTKYGKKRWADTTILGILKNEKYKGDLLQGKTFTLDPITKKRADNKGESDQYYITDHHDPIVSREEWDKANATLKRRSDSRRMTQDGERARFSKAFVFSSSLECGFCGKRLSRRGWHGSKNYSKVVWQCMSFAKEGKEACPHCKGIPEEAIEGAFVDAYNHLMSDDSGFVNRFLEKTEGYMADASLTILIEKNLKSLQTNQDKIDRLASAFVDGTMSEEAYQTKLRALTAEKGKLQKEREDLEYKERAETEMGKRLQAFREAAIESNGEELKEFNEDLYNACIEKVIVGGYDEKKAPDPYMLTFIFKQEFGSAGIQNGKGYKKVTEFTHYFQHVVFTPYGKTGKRKELSNYIRVVVAINS